MKRGTSSRKRFTRCVAVVSARQHSEARPYNAFAVCRSSTGYKGTSHKIGLRQYEAILKRGIRQEQIEHPQLSYKDAVMIAEQHLKENPNYYR